jgi:hypothetical protein
MAISESDAERQARIEADIRRLFARYRRGSASDGDRSQEAADAERRIQHPSTGRFGSHPRPAEKAPRNRPSSAL